MRRERNLAACAFVFTLILSATSVCAQLVPGSMDVRWDAGAPDCKANPQPPIQVHRYEPETFFLRQNLCVSFEGNFLYLLIGSQKALLIDSGAIRDPARMPVAKTVLDLLPARDDFKMPLLVVHTHGHTDHRDGDAQFASLANVQVAPYDLMGVQKFFGFPSWPNGLAHIDLGQRMVDVIPAPGHHPAHLVYYDHRTGLLFTGDFFLPGRLLIEDTADDKQSAARVIDFVNTHAVRYVLGAHIELDRDGNTYMRASQYHPQEHSLELTREDLLQLPAALNRFNGFYSRYGNLVLMNPVRVLAAEAITVLVALALIVWSSIRFARRVGKRKKYKGSAS
jgi:glyoxylase-like metal-dependent hydrolase (beta-lactamase superfamily II)